MNKVTVVSAITSATGITLYLADGRTHELPATGYRTKAIMDEIAKPLARRQKIEIDLDTYSVEVVVEKKSRGLIRFVREKISAFGSLFGIGATSTAAVPVPVLDPMRSAPSEPETLVAIVDGKKIPGMEKLATQIEHAAVTNTVGLERFLARLAAVIDERGHSVQELLNFMEKGDLPIADDGSIVAYKMLYDRGDHMVDPHTKKVRQKLGSRVSMDEKLVDPSRRVECSQGLHVARRGYVKSFHGDVITLIKVDPEDVIAVPHNEPNKMRACAYHIVGVLPREGADLVRQDKPMTSHTPSAQMLANVIAGEHVGVIQRVVIGGANGTDVVITDVDGANPEVVITDETRTAKALDESEQPKVTIKEMRAVVEEAVAEERSKAGWTSENTLTDEEEADLDAELEQQAIDNGQIEPEPVAEVQPEPAPAPKRAAAARVDRIEKLTDKAVAERPKRYKTPKPVEKPKKSSFRKGTLEGAKVSAPKAPPKGMKTIEEIDLTKVPETYRKAFELFVKGERSQRQLEKDYNISAKTIRRLVREHATK